MAKALDVAKYLLHLKNQDMHNGEYYTLSNLKLQKLLYYCQGGHYRWDNRPLIDENEFQAWPYGPVIPSVYGEYKKFGQNDIIEDEINFELDQPEKETIQAIWEQLKYKDAFSLVDSTHEEPPWLKTKLWSTITDDKIRQHFEI